MGACVGQGDGRLPVPIYATDGGGVGYGYVWRGSWAIRFGDVCPLSDEATGAQAIGPLQFRNVTTGGHVIGDSASQLNATSAAKPGTQNPKVPGIAHFQRQLVPKTNRQQQFCGASTSGSAGQPPSPQVR
ncbi:hypothetical protein NLG97_g6704 [Lecanicillium saksenae]|uniref:Uncharacterized protein n=1 Tax=Lecanicillium saksenae TaxID=468837 RepID=A0ACC1QQ13_9HYPO|nr:hypothetical protein NLG97_g6704 [Lecanicillium saksenae]